jgi:hypothetical protein
MAEAHARPAGDQAATQQPGQPGRPRTFDAAQQAAFCALVRLGCSRTAAADVVGVSARTVCRTIQRDEQFAEQLHRAEGTRQMTLLNRIDQASNKHWRAAAWLLHRGWPQQFAPRDPNVVTNQEALDVVQAIVQVVLEEVTDPECLRRVRQRVEAICRQMNQASIERATRPRVRKSKLTSCTPRKS